MPDPPRDPKDSFGATVRARGRYARWLNTPKPAVRVRGWSGCDTQHHVRRLLADHNRRHIGSARCQRRHDRGIGDPQTPNAMDAKWASTTAIGSDPILQVPTGW